LSIACYFEIHITEGVFTSENVGEDGETAIWFKNETHSDTSNRAFEWDTYKNKEIGEERGEKMIVKTEKRSKFGGVGVEKNRKYF
jgi:hypothetical protein